MEKKIDMLEKYKSVAFKYEKEMMKRDDVIGVMQLGGIARNRAASSNTICGCACVLDLTAIQSNLFLSKFPRSKGAFYISTL